MANVTLKQALTFFDLRHAIARKMGTTADNLNIEEDNLVSVAKALGVLPTVKLTEYATKSGKNAGVPSVYLDVGLSRYECFVRHGSADDLLTQDIVDSVNDTADKLEERADALRNMASILSCMVDAD